MPDPLAGVTLSEAAAEAAAIAPITRVLLDTLEFRRASLVDELGNPAAIRVVIDKQDLLATLEATAPLDAGTEVLFRKVSLRHVRPAETEEGAAPQLVIEIDGVSSELTELLDEDLDLDDPVYVTHRIYASDQRSAPAVTPVLQMELVSSEVGETSARLTCVFGDPINSGWPRVGYTRKQYPGLAAR